VEREAKKEYSHIEEKKAKVNSISNSRRQAWKTLKKKK
jgi:hypothetical protein